MRVDLPLPLQLPLPVGDVLVVHHDYAHHPRTRALVVALQNRLAQLAQGSQEVQLLNPYSRSAAALLDAATLLC